MKQKITLLLMFLLSFSAYSQYAENIRGYIVDTEMKSPLPGISVVLKNQKLSSITDSNGEFSFPNAQVGDDYLIFQSSMVGEVEMPITITGSNQNLGEFNVVSKKIMIERGDTDIFLSTLDDTDLDSEADMSSQGISSLVILSDDIFLNNASYQLSQARFRPRGYASRFESTSLNGIQFNDQNRGMFNYSMIGAMNDVTRNGDALNYMQLGNFTYGSIGGSQNIDLRASNYAKGGTLRASYGNGNYYLRSMASYSTGLMDNGWAFTGLIGGRYSDEGFIKGSFYHNASYFFSAEKQWDGGKHSLSLVTFGSPTQRALGTAVVKEAYELMDDYFYNPTWGYQNGDKRTTGIVTAYDPTVILSHILNFDKETKLTTGFGAHYSNYGKTALNWTGNAPDPRPDYYRNLPSYQSDVIPEGETQSPREKLTNVWRSKNRSITQINWDNLYEANRGRDTALYMVEERHNDLFEMSLNSTLDAKLNEHINIIAGIGARSTRAMAYKTANDMLGSGYLVDIDKFGERDFPEDPDILQNDLNNPNRKIYEDDRFGYNYNTYIRSGNAWVQNQHQYNRFDLYYGIKFGYTNFYREGKMRNGRYPANSFGKGDTHDFVDQNYKAGITYKLDGRNFLVANISYGVQAPLPDNAYITPRVSDAKVPNLQSEKILSADIGYVFSFPMIRGRLSAFQTNFYDQTQKTSYFHDLERTFIHHVMYNVNKIHRGLELGLEWKATNDLTLSFAGTMGDYYYSKNPDSQIFYENNKVQLNPEKVSIDNFYVGGTPQYAGTIGANYFYKYWFFGANLNGFARSYLDPSPILRVPSSFTTFPSAETEEEFNANVKEFTKQTKLNGGMTVDLSVGKLLFLKGGRSINFNASVKNLLNYEKIQTGGYEQGRLDKDAYTRTKFPAKFYYMQGINFFVNVAYKFK